MNFKKFIYLFMLASFISLFSVEKKQAPFFKRTYNNFMLNSKGRTFSDFSSSLFLLAPQIFLHKKLDVFLQKKIKHDLTRNKVSEDLKKVNKLFGIGLFIYNLRKYLSYKIPLIATKSQGVDIDLYNSFQLLHTLYLNDIEIKRLGNDPKKYSIMKYIFDRLYKMIDLERYKPLKESSIINAISPDVIQCLNTFKGYIIDLKYEKVDQKNGVLEYIQSIKKSIEENNEKIRDKKGFYVSNFYSLIEKIQLEQAKKSAEAERFGLSADSNYFEKNVKKVLLRMEEELIYHEELKLLIEDNLEEEISSFIDKLAFSILSNKLIIDPLFTKNESVELAIKEVKRCFSILKENLEDSTNLKEENKKILINYFDLYIKYCTKRMQSDGYELGEGSKYFNLNIDMETLSKYILGISGNEKINNELVNKKKQKVLLRFHPDKNTDKIRYNNIFNIITDSEKILIKKMTNFQTTRDKNLIVFNKDLKEKDELSMIKEVIIFNYNQNVYSPESIKKLQDIGLLDKSLSNIKKTEDKTEPIKEDKTEPITEDKTEPITEDKTEPIKIEIKKIDLSEELKRNISRNTKILIFEIFSQYKKKFKENYDSIKSLSSAGADEFEAKVTEYFNSMKPEIINLKMEYNVDKINNELKNDFLFILDKYIDSYLKLTDINIKKVYVSAFLRDTLLLGQKENFKVNNKNVNLLKNQFKNE